MKLFRLLFLLLLSTPSFSQNLVQNPSFEDTNACPRQINQVNFANGWESWAGTPDYFNTCANSSAPNFGIPVNNRGFQDAHSGDAYMGLFTFTIANPNGREFIGGTLTAPLIVGRQYFVSFWVNHADTSVLGFATDKLGVKFSTVPFSWFASPDTVNNAPHVFSNTVITDTADWVLIQGSFTADSAYAYFGIGNYFEDSLTNMSQIGSGTANYAYYLIDDVCISSNAKTCAGATGFADESVVSSFKIYPNPNKGNFIVDMPDKLFNSGAILTISNLMGQVVHTSTIQGKTNVLKMELPDGFYIFNVSYNKESSSEKVVVQN